MTCAVVVILCLCQSLLNNKDTENTFLKTDSNQGEKVKEHNLASFFNLSEVYLQTVRVVLYSDSCKCESQRSYIRSEVTKALGYMPNGNVEFAHALFGGVNTHAQSHGVSGAREKFERRLCVQFYCYG